MNLFELFYKMTHMYIPALWEETTATFTGKTRKATVKAARRIIEADYNAYEIVYYAGDEKIHSWHVFHPLPDPDPNDLLQSTLRIRYKKRKPTVFKVILSG
ncbi:MAG: hypothetical protein IJ526_14170 [Lachnospiraceae bacterium]|nr:hypothetical protein [Lachnospiraceae bacterium]